jgi:ATP-dependent helicase HrpA
MTGIYINTFDWPQAKLPPHLLMKFNILDKQGNSLAKETNLGVLQKQYAHLARGDIQNLKHSSFKQQQGLTRWGFGELPQAIQQQKHGMSIALFPALVDKQTSVDIELFESEQAAAAAMRQGLRRLLILSLHQQADMLRKNMPHQQALALYYAAIAQSEDLREDIIAQTFETVFLQGLRALPRNEKDFQELLDNGRAQVVKAGKLIAEQTLEALKSYAGLQQNISNIKAAALKPVVDDIEQQLSKLIYPGFVLATPTQWLPHLPRFIQAANIRLQKAGQNLKQDTANSQAVFKLWQTYALEKKQLEKHHENTNDLTEFRWLIEELRVSLFAQSLKTSVPISIKRLSKKMDTLKH